MTLVARLEEYQQIEIAIELDKGRSIESVADQFGISTQFIRNIAIKAGFSSPKKKKRSRSALNAEDQNQILDLILEGEELTTIALDFDISVASLRQLCKRHNVPIPRSQYQLTKTECAEIRELLTANEPLEEIARAYNISRATVESLQEGYRQLDELALGFLYETLLENPDFTAQSIRKLAKKAGFEIDESIILSYHARLKKLHLI